MVDHQSSTKPPLAKKPKIQKKWFKRCLSVLQTAFNNFRNFKFLIVEEKPSFSIGNFYAVCAHFDSEICNLVNSHYDVLIDTTTFENDTLKRYQSFPVPFLTQI